MNVWYATTIRTALWLLVAASTAAHADFIAYDKVVDLQAEVGTLRVEHHHDWSSATREASRWKMVFSTKNPFSADNDYSYLRLRDNRTGTEFVSSSRAGADVHLDFSQF